jgi:hypothetical protein
MAEGLLIGKEEEEIEGVKHGDDRWKHVVLHYDGQGKGGAEDGWGWG